MDNKEILQKFQLGQLSKEEVKRLLQNPEKNIASEKINNKNVVPEHFEIAIIGYSCIFPGAKNATKYWENIANGVDSIVEIPANRWSINEYYDPNPQAYNKSYSKWGGFLEDVDLFDATFFNISPEEAKYIDPQARLFLQEAWKALEDAGYSEEQLSNYNCGVYVGVMLNDYLDQIEKYGTGQLVPHMMQGNSNSILAARIAYYLNLKGPAISIDTACSSSLVALHLACEHLQLGQADMMLAGGVSLYLSPKPYIFMSKAGMLAKSKVCSPFDANADGMIPGEGVGVLVLKRLDKALADGDSIHGIIKATGINQDGHTNGITAPSANSQINLLSNLYHHHGITLNSMDYIECHGTATPLGDPIELHALNQLYINKVPTSTKIALGSVKANIGHTSAAAGVAGIIKILQALKYQQLPPQIHFSTLNSQATLENSLFFINTQLKNWQTENNRPRRAGVSSFGFSGTNAHVVIEEAPAKETSLELIQGPYFAVISAKTKHALNAKLEELLNWLLLNENKYRMADICYSLNVGRSHFEKRIAFVIDNFLEFKEAIQDFLKNVSHPSYVALSDEQSLLISSDQKSSELMNVLQKEISDLMRTANLKLLRSRLLSLGHLYINKQKIDWKNFYSSDISLKKIQLPTYPFAKESHWIGPRNIIKDTNELMENLHYFTHVWNDFPLLEGHDFKEQILLFDIDQRIYNMLIQKGIDTNQIILINPANEFKKSNNNHFQVAINQIQNYHQLLLNLSQKNSSLHILYCWGLSTDGSKFVKDLEMKELKIAEERGPLAFFLLTQALMEHFWQQEVKIVYLYATNHFSYPIHAAVNAFSKTCKLENKRFNCCVMGINQEEIFQLLTHALYELKAANPKVTEIKYENNKRWVGNYQFIDKIPKENQLPPSLDKEASSPKDTSTGFRMKGCYLITGGLGGLGFLFTKHLITCYQAKIIIIGRSPLAGEKLIAFKELQSLNAQCHYFQCDITDYTQALKLKNEIESHFGLLNGVLHCAGLIRDSVILRKTLKDFTEVLAPKIMGTIHLDKITADYPLDFFVLFSSVASVIGNFGQADYALANNFMDNFANLRHQRVLNKERSGKSISINWPLWLNGGMHIKEGELELITKEVGMQPLPDDVGIKAFEECLGAVFQYTTLLPFYGDKMKWQTRLLNDAMFNTSTSPAAFMNNEKFSISSSNHNQNLNINFNTRIEEWLASLIGQILGILPSEIEPDRALEYYGLDSFMMKSLQQKLEIYLPALTPTLFYEYQTLRELATYLNQTHKQVFSKILEPVSSGDLKSSIKTTEIAGKKEENYKPNNSLDLSLDIAIIGLNGTYPDAKNINQFWQNLFDGKDSVRSMAQKRQQLYSDLKINFNDAISQLGGYIDEVANFDAEFFGISAHEAKMMDPQERLFLQSAWQCCESAGYANERLDNLMSTNKQTRNVGVFVGVTSSSYQLLGAQLWSEKKYNMPAGHYWSMANRVSYFLDLNGPSMAVDTACSSSLVAIHLACESIKRKECVAAIAGGVNLYLHPSRYFLLEQSGFISKNGRCHSFGAKADGMVPAEGVGAILLRPLSDAIRDGDFIYGIIKGTAMNHGGRANGYTTPDLNAQCQVVQSALQQAQIKANTLSYIEAHGTGTSLGDPIEIRSLTKAFGERFEINSYCAIGSVKSNMGHAESAAGIAALTKVLLQMKYQTLVPTLHANPINPNIDFQSTPFYLPQEIQNWNRLKIKEKDVEYEIPRRAGINAFGAGGVNAHIIIEEYEAINNNANEYHKKVNARELFIFSAHTEDCLKSYIEEFVVFLEDTKNHLNGSLNLQDIAYTLQVARSSFNYRLIVLADSIENLCFQLLDYFNFNKENKLFQSQNWQYNNLNSNANFERSSELNAYIKSLFSTHKLEQVGKLWLQGAYIDWSFNTLNKNLHIVPLPTLSFQKTRYWLYDIQTKDDSDKLNIKYESNAHTSILENKPPEDNLENKNIKQKISDIIREMSDDNPLAIDFNLSPIELGVSSINLMNLKYKLEAEFLVTISMQMLGGDLSINELITFIKEYSEQCTI